MQKCLNILSLDLDWFNIFSYSQVREKIRHLFAGLQEVCTLPDETALMVEHHYLYPWSMELMRRRKARKVDVVNIDFHHDFYYLASLDYNDKDVVGCGNFFAFMAHDNILRNYRWVTGSNSPLTERADLIDQLRAATCSKVRAVAKRIRVHSSRKVLDVARSRKFDGFAVIKSLGYTKRQKTVFQTVERMLQNRFVIEGSEVHRNDRRARFRYERRHDMANSFAAAS